MLLGIRIHIKRNRKKNFYKTLVSPQEYTTGKVY